MKLHFTFHLISIHPPLPVAVVPVESASRTCVLPSVVSTVTRFPSMDTAWAQVRLHMVTWVGALDPLAQHLVHHPFRYARTLADHVPEVGDAAHQ